MAKFRKLIALLLVFVMSFSLLGVTGVFAADTGTQYVYVYVKNTDAASAGDQVNGHDYYTIGRIQLELPAADSKYTASPERYKKYKDAITTALRQARPRSSPTRFAKRRFPRMTRRSSLGLPANSMASRRSGPICARSEG